MFKEFDKAALQALISLLKTPQDGIAYINKAFEAPSRNVQGNGGNRVGAILCPKMGCEISTESYHAEWRATMQHIFNEEVLGYLSQPPRIEITYRGKNNRKVRTTTIPDFIVFKRGSFELQEWKQSEALARLVEGPEGRFVYDENGNVRSPCAEAAAAALGMTYKICVDTDISCNASSNYEFLKTYLTDRAKQEYGKKTAAVQRHLTKFSYATAADLLNYVGGCRDTLHFCIAHGIVTLEWDTVELATQSNYFLFRDEKVRDTFCDAHGVKSNVARFPVLKPGERGRLDGKEIQFTFVGETRVSFVGEQNQPVTVSVNWLHEQFQLGLFSSTRATAEETEVSESFRRASTAAIGEAVDRRDWLEAPTRRKKCTSASKQPSERTFRRWLKRADEAKGTRESKLAVLLPRYRDRGNRTPRTSEALQELTTDAIKKQLEDPSQQSIRQSYLTYELDCIAKGMTAIAMTSYYDRLNNLRDNKTVKKSEGHKVAAADLPAYWQLEAGSLSHGQFPFEEVHVDHTRLDLGIRSSVTGEDVGKPWLSIAMDGASRRVFAMHLSLLPPSSYTLIALVHNMLHRFGRRPDRLVHDWGSEFRGNTATSLRRLLDFDMLLRPKSMPRFGAVLERLFGSATSEVIHNLLGNTKVMKTPRTVTAGINPENFTCHTLLSVHHLLEQFFFEEYDSERRHPALLVSPRDYFEDLMTQTGRRPHQLVRCQDYLPHLFPDARGRTRTLNSRTGIFVNYEYYGHEALTRLSDNGVELPTKFNPLDPSMVWVDFEGSWIECKSRRYGELQKAPPICRQYYFQEFLFAMKAMRLGNKKSRLVMADLIDKANASMLAKKDMFSTKEGKALWSKINFFDANSEPAVKDAESSREARQSDKLKAMFAAAVSNRIDQGGYGDIAR